MLSSSNSRTLETNTTNNTSTDARVAADNGAIVTRGDVTVTDGGAIRMAGDISERAIEAGEMFGRLGEDIAGKSFGVVDRAFDFGVAGFQAGQEAQEGTREVLGQILEAERSESTQLSSQLIRIGIPAIALIFIVQGMNK